MKNTMKIKIFKHLNSIKPKKKSLNKKTTRALSLGFNKKILPSSKHSQIATTITWFVAFLIIFFIMLIFISVSALLAGKKAFPLIGEGFSSVEVLKSSNNMFNQRMLYFIINSPSEDGKIIRDLIIAKDTKKIEENVKNILTNIDRKCYVFNLKYDSGEVINVKKGMDKYDPSVDISNPDFTGGGRINKNQVSVDYLVEKYDANLILGNQKINAVLYTEKC